MAENDNGAVADNGVKEKDITLSIAKKIADLNSNTSSENYSLKR